MPRLAGIQHLDALRAFRQAGFRILRQGEHIMTDGLRNIAMTRNYPINALIRGGIIRDAGLTIEEFRAPL